jgi:uncharacterized protein
MVPEDRSTQPRIPTLDILRGVAVMGILLMNITNFAMPDAAYINPAAWGGTSPSDIATWMLNFIFVDSKMRALFSMLFGASMLLFLERAEQSGQDAVGLHLRRMGWLLAFGLLHYFFIWEGDILSLYALCGLYAWTWQDLESPKLLRRGIVLIGCSVALWAVIMGSALVAQSKASTAHPTKKQARISRELAADLGAPGSADIARDLTRYRSSYGAITRVRLLKNPSAPLSMALLFGLETLGLMALGMALLKNGFLTGRLPRAAYVRTAVYGIGFSTVPLAGFALWSLMSGFDPLTTAAGETFWSIPFRAPLAIGYAALIIVAVQSYSKRTIIARIAAAGQTAFSNYIGTSILMTSLFYGYGFGLYGHVSRSMLFALVVPAWLMMLLWSKPWMDRYRHGPLEWLWRSLTRWEQAPMKRV